MEQDEDADAEEHMLCDGCKKELPDRCECNSVIAAFHDVNKKLLELKLLERLTGDVVTSLVRHKVDSFPVDFVAIDTLVIYKSSF